MNEVVMAISISSLMNPYYVYHWKIIWMRTCTYIYPICGMFWGMKICFMGVNIEVVGLSKHGNYTAFV